MEYNHENLFDQAMALYKEGAEAEKILPSFLKITEAAPRLSAGWTCLAWLQLLCEKPEDALRSAKLAVRLNPQDPQAHINLSLALLDTKSKGVRDHIQVVQKILALSPHLTKDIKNSLEDGHQRRPKWQALEKVEAWLSL